MEVPGESTASHVANREGAVQACLVQRTCLPTAISFTAGRQVTLCERIKHFKAYHCLVNNVGISSWIKMPYPVSATHRAVACPDIVLDIIEQVSPPWSSTESLDGAWEVQCDRRNSLAAMARACKAFNGPATKSLWSRLDSFIPLMNLFSAFNGRGMDPTYVRSSPYTIFPGHTCLAHIFSQMISGDIPPHEFSRFLELGGFLKAVAPSECICGFDTADSDVWHYLARIAGGKPLFPSLQVLHWAIFQPSSAEILFLLTSSVRRLTVCYGNSQDTHEWRLSQNMLFRTVFDIAPLLTHLTINDVHTTLLPACLSNVGVLRGLRAVSLYHDASVDLHILRTLSTMGSLEEISFATDIDWLDEPVDFSGFPTLKKLEMSVMSGSAESARSWLNAFSSPGLRRLTFRIHTELLNTDEISATCALFAHRFPLLEDLTWSVLIHHAVLFETALAPLFPLRMVNLSLQLHGSPAAAPDFPDDLFASLAKAWPQLVALSIATPDERVDTAPTTRTITAQTLLVLAHGCPRLRTLRLPRMQSPRIEDVRGYPVLRHGLRMLFVDRPGVANEDSYAASALLLDRLFPELDLDCAVRGLEAFMNLNFGWKRVMGALRLCRLGRDNLML